jgi:1,4-alpha-glucan branching enzyme
LIYREPTVLTKRHCSADSCEVTFELPPAVGGEVAFLCGEFNGWSETDCSMERLPDGGFTVTLTLPSPGRFQFRYLLDGTRWVNDWAADDYTPNGLGGNDSVVTT